jgi:hypothetical protein
MGTGIRILREQVAEAMDEGAPLDDVDRSVIKQATLTPELRSALWLYAWGLSEREVHSPTALERLRS